MSSYENVVGGKLQLKRPQLRAVGQIVTKKPKKHKAETAAPVEIDPKLLEEIEAREVEESDLAAAAAARAAASKKATLEPEDTRTPAEIAFEKARRKREKETIAEKASKSHKERIQELNSRLANMSEHHDMPKIQSAGQG